LRQQGIPLPAGYLSYLSAFLHADGFTVENLKVGSLAEVMALQDAIVSHLDHPEWLRENSEETFADCLQNHVVIGLRHNGHIVAIAILVDAGGTSGNLQRFLSDTPVVIQSSCNLKLVAVHPDFRERGLASSLIELLEGEATKRGFRRIVCTVHPYNRASRSIFTTLGYRVKKKVQTSYGKRMIYQRTFQVLTRGAIK
jgi:ribosomal protein S18 acetylase RimI-like enzyme